MYSLQTYAQNTVLHYDITMSQCIVTPLLSMVNDHILQMPQVDIWLKTVECSFEHQKEKDGRDRITLAAV